MKKISFAIIILLFSFVNAEYIHCNVLKKNIVFCSYEEMPGQMSIYHLKKDGTWVMKLYFFKDENFESVYVRTYKNFDYLNACLSYELYEIMKLKNDYTDSELEDVQEKCKVVSSTILDDIKSGKKMDIPNFDLAFSNKYDEPFSMHCGFHMYVETNKFNKKGVVTSKKKYELIPGDYCKKFLSNDQIYWKP